MAARLLSGLKLDPWSEIILLEPKNIRTETAFALEHNKSRRYTSSDIQTFDIREDTPSRASSPARINELAVSFVELPKDITVGYVLGSSDSCDVIIGKRSDGVSSRHLIITFDQREKLIMKDVSRKGSHVSYDSQPSHLRTKPFIWVLPTDYLVTVRIGDSILFTIQIPSHHAHSRQYQAQVLRFLSKAQSALPSIGGLGLETSASTTVSSAPLSNMDSSSKPVYVTGLLIGSGTFGRVFKVYNASNWEVYARKEVINILGGAKSETDAMKREVATLQRLSHTHIVQYVDVCTIDNGTALVTEFYEHGSLEAEAERNPFDASETTAILQQLSSALEHVHELEIVHRDIKPANILVKAREPLHVVLADFGLAKVRTTTFASTLCGTPLYLAPEMYDYIDTEHKQSHSEDDTRRKQSSSKVNTKRLQYWEAVDIWSLGVVGLEYSHGLPKTSKVSEIPQLMTRKATRLFKTHPHEPFVSLLRKMLQQDPLDRPTAKECYEDLKRITCLETSHHVINDQEGNESQLRTIRIVSSDSSDSLVQKPASHICSNLSTKKRSRIISSNSRKTKRQHHSFQQPIDEEIEVGVLPLGNQCKDAKCAGSSIAEMAHAQELDSTFERRNVAQIMASTKGAPVTESEVWRLLQDS